jgi:hypothetical protein
MRKCYLCGSILRRRAEFCRYCTVRQPDAPGTGSLPPGAGEHDPAASMPPVPPAPIDTTSLEQAMAPQARSIEREGHEVDLSAEPPPRAESPAPAVYEIDPAPTPDEAPLPAALTPTAARPRSTPDARTNGRNGRDHRGGRNGHDNGTTPSKPATTLASKAPSTPASEPATKAPSQVTTGNGSSNGSTNGADRRNGAHATNGHDDAEGRNGHADEKTAARRRTTALSGFEHFPDATATPKVRWG